MSLADLVSDTWKRFQGELSRGCGPDLWKILAEFGCQMIRGNCSAPTFRYDTPVLPTCCV